MNYQLNMLASLVLFLITPQGSQRDISLGTPKNVIGTAEQGLYLNYGIDYAMVGGDTLAIIDRREPAIYLVTTSGSLLTTFGRGGMGPGEYVEPTTIRVQQGIIYVGDRILNRITAYHSDGSLLTTIPIDGSPRTFVIYGDSLIVGTALSQAAIQIISASNSFEPVQLLRYDDTLFDTNRYPVYSLELALDVSKLYCLVREANMLMRTDLREYTIAFQCLDLFGPTIDARRKDYNQTITNLRPNAWIPFIAFNGSMSVLPTGHLLLTTAIPDEMSDLRRTSRGVIIDPRTGSEVSIRLRPDFLTTMTMRCLTNNILAGFDIDSALITLYDLPSEVLALDIVDDEYSIGVKKKRFPWRWIIAIFILSLCLAYPLFRFTTLQLSK